MSTQQITVSRWSVEQFFGAAEAWKQLLARSDADPLFMSWDWLQAWWSAHEGPYGLKLRIFAAYSGDRLLGIAPLVTTRSKTRIGIVSTRYQWLGQLFRVPGSAMSEHMDFVVASGQTREVGEALLDAIVADAEWGELVLGNVLLDHSVAGSLIDRMRSAARYLRVTDGMISSFVACEGSFDDFTARLGAGTRSRVLGGRSRLARHGELAERLFGYQDMNEFFDIFDDLHRHRWGWSTFSGHRGQFYRDFLSRMAASGRAKFSVLMWSGQPISAMIDIRLSDREYALQSAFEIPKLKRVSPGLVHLGFRIQDTFESGLKSFELLGGSGKNEDYKTRLGAIERPMATIHAVRNRTLASMHAGYDWLKRFASRSG